jgi:hypothetical protein
VSFRQAEVRTLVEEQRMVVRRDRDNPHDPLACVVETLGGEVVGFVPRDLAKRLSENDRDIWGARVVEVLRGETWGIRLEITNESPAQRETPEWSGGTERVAGLDEATRWGAGRSRVRGLSGRDLGVLVKSENGRVLVENRGCVVSYPAQIVTIEQ